MRKRKSLTCSSCGNSTVYKYITVVPVSESGDADILICDRCISKCVERVNKASKNLEFINRLMHENLGDSCVLCRSTNNALLVRHPWGNSAAHICDVCIRQCMSTIDKPENRKLIRQHPLRRRQQKQANNASTPDQDANEARSADGRQPRKRGRTKCNSYESVRFGIESIIVGLPSFWEFFAFTAVDNPGSLPSLVNLIPARLELESQQAGLEGK